MLAVDDATASPPPRALISRRKPYQRDALLFSAACDRERGHEGRHSELSDTDALIESLEQVLVKKRDIKQGAMQQLLTGKRRLVRIRLVDWKNPAALELVQST